MMVDQSRKEDEGPSVRGSRNRQGRNIRISQSNSRAQDQLATERSSIRGGREKPRSDKEGGEPNGGADEQ